MHAVPIILAILTVLTSQGLAQRSISYRLTVFGTGKIDKKSYVNRPADDTAIKAIRGYVADPVKATLRDDLYLDFFEEGRQAVGDEPLKPDFTITVPPDCGREPLILLFQEGDKVKPKFVDFRKLNIGTGDQLLFNLLPVPVALSYSDGAGEKWNQPVIVSPGTQKRIPAPREAAVNRRVFAKNMETGKFVVINRGTFLRAQNGREVMFCYMKKGEPVPTLETILIHDVDTGQND